MVETLGILSIQTKFISIVNLAKNDVDGEGIENDDDDCDQVDEDYTCEKFNLTNISCII